MRLRGAPGDGERSFPLRKGIIALPLIDSYGIWYARNDIVKAALSGETSKTRAT